MRLSMVYGIPLLVVIVLHLRLEQGLEIIIQEKYQAIHSIMQQIQSIRILESVRWPVQAPLPVVYLPVSTWRHRRGSSLLLDLQFCTGNDLQNRDPFTITIEGSNQAPSLLTLGSSWTLIYNGSTGLQPFTNRYTCGAILSVPNNSVWYSSYRILSHQSAVLMWLLNTLRWNSLVINNF